MLTTISSWGYKLLLRLSTSNVRRALHADGLFRLSFRALAWESSVAKYGIFNNSHKVRISLFAIAKNITVAIATISLHEVQYHSHAVRI